MLYLCHDLCENFKFDKKTLTIMLVNNTEQTHSLGAVMKCACLLILFAFGVDVYAQSYNASNSYRVGGYTQPT